MWSIALVVVASLAALIAFYSLMVRCASFVDESESGIPAPKPAPAAKMRKAA